MRHLLLIFAALAGAAILVLLLAGGEGRVVQWAAERQRDFQNALAGTLRALRAGEAGAIWAMAGLCFGYGVVHAIGPGHGKFLIGGYGVGRRVPALRLSAIALAASLGQAVTAIAVVGLGFAAFGWTRDRTIGTVEGWMAPASAIAIGAVGLWLVLRALRRIFAGRDGAGACCGHAHGPDPAAVEASRDWREVAALVLGIAIRPCTGAILLLVLAWHMEIRTAGIVGTFAMSLGTGVVTIVVAISAVMARQGLLAAVASDGGHARMLLPAIELAAGTAIAILAFGMLQAG